MINYSQIKSPAYRSSKLVYKGYEVKYEQFFNCSGTLIRERNSVDDIEIADCNFLDDTEYLEIDNILDFLWRKIDGVH
jgi:hypothetical protein